ncbi:Doubled CXXCH motif (Paired_CXXCH_1) [Posidoniimonas corsicana]|uniref:Doubled CXXCH motif (Paired_CXXCH_1) n=1 Tax=Posidoniimonas corsicana TaxID=1938618 RepID=A0A5C5VHZ1_9BACT|nr:multiheme c-type cytochrome [Posidoniimonas corsicana]TWT37560.1 Doubled CXXCH motif (Paired_CXXCH_1) [Posidoniimonas corsicana]
MHRAGHLGTAGLLVGLLLGGVPLGVPAAHADPITDHFPEAANSGCMKCHAGVELIREPDSPMMQQIMTLGAAEGDPAGCVICHGGDPSETADKAVAHGGDFYPAPGSPWINEHTCGRCHAEHVDVQWTSLMMTEAGKIQGVAWAFGSLTGYQHKWGNYAVENPTDPADRLGTPEYRAYMARLKQLEPNVFVDKHEPLPDAPAKEELARLHEDPSLAAFTYLRQECQRCHHAVKGRQKRGDYRGMGCASCHTPYGNEGFYEGGDPTIDRTAPGHMLVHSLQGTRDAQVTVHEKTYSGIPVETCTTCHDRGKRIGVSFQGLMETPYHSPFAADGGPQPALHTKHYIAMEQDIHYQKGMTCQDCHTSIDVHSDGFLAAANLAAVQIECADCHGTPEKFPWELPLGYMDEFAMAPADGGPRGVAQEQLPHTLQGDPVDARDGFLLTARGNPYENVVRDGDQVIVHTAAGQDLRIKPLKTLIDEGAVSSRGVVAMKSVASHMEKMECYTCHSTWTPQCYGCHVKVDYSQKDKCPECAEDMQAFDWVAAGRKHQDEPDHRADRGEAGYDTVIPGKVSEQRSYLRWEEPMLGVNGEGRVTPLAPGCQPSVTIIGEDGKPVLVNHIFKVEPGLERSDDGQLAIDMSPVQPHTTTKNARTCESCHASAKALGLGIGGPRPWDEQRTVDLQAIDGTILPRQSQPQMEPVENLTHDWSQIVDAEGNQLATVGHHFQLSRAFNREEQLRISREGTCLSCHREIPYQSTAVNLLHHVAKYTGQLPKHRDEHDSLVHKILLLSAWGQVLGVLTVVCAVGGGAYWWRRRRAAG